MLVDEFQDTDPVQWDVLRLAFHGHATLVLIGDPKQAIYAFRGADVQAYLAAAELADHQATLAQNWRSDPDLLRGLEAMFRGAALGDPRIVVLPVSAAHPGRSLDVAGAPVRIRVVPKGQQPKLLVGPARELVIRDVVAEVVDLLDSGALLRPRDGSPERPVEPGDIAVIVRTGTQLDLVHAALLAAGVPAVERTTASVFRTAAGADWIVLLEALEQPHRSGRLRRLAISPFVGLDAAGLEAADVDRLGLRLRYWVSVFEERGVAALYETVSRDQRLPSRLLGQLDGERRLTDLRHVGEALHAAAMAGQLGLTASVEWLRRRVEESADDSSVERSRRLDSDDAAVQVVTVHASKGLEFPVVYVPFAWDRYTHEQEIPLYHDDSGRRVRNVGGVGSPGFGPDQRRHNSEEFGEDLRLLYVALTRAQSQVTAWWAPSSKNTPSAPLHRLLFTDDPAAGIEERVTVPNDATAFARLSSRALDGCLSVTCGADALRCLVAAAAFACGRARRRSAVARARHVLAPHVLQRADRGRPRCDPGDRQRARGRRRRTTSRRRRCWRRPGTWRCLRSRHRWVSCLAALRSGRLCTPFWRRSTRRRPSSRTRCVGTSGASWRVSARPVSILTFCPNRCCRRCGRRSVRSRMDAR